jgi:hypothetical protein
MAKDPRKHQKKLERKRAKQKARKKAIQRIDAGSTVSRIERSASSPILHCLRSDPSTGMCNVLVSRAMPSGNVAFVMFLVDAYCLGVKDVMFDVVSRVRYDMQYYGDLVKKYDVEELTPEAGRKYVEGAVDYALELGFAPHKDYAKAQRIFGDIDAAACSDEFEYGRDGKPLFVAGPHDSASRRDRIMSMLEARCGPNGYHYMIPVRDPGMIDVDND